MEKKDLTNRDYTWCSYAHTHILHVYSIDPLAAEFKVVVYAHTHNFTMYSIDPLAHSS